MSDHVTVRRADLKALFEAIGNGFVLTPGGALFRKPVSAADAAPVNEALAHLYLASNSLDTGGEQQPEESGKEGGPAPTSPVSVGDHRGAAPALSARLSLASVTALVNIVSTQHEPDELLSLRAGDIAQLGLAWLRGEQSRLERAALRVSAQGGHPAVLDRIGVVVYDVPEGVMGVCLEPWIFAQGASVADLYAELERVIVVHAQVAREKGQAPLVGRPAPRRFDDAFNSPQAVPLTTLNVAFDEALGLAPVELVIRKATVNPRPAAALAADSLRDVCEGRR